MNAVDALLEAFAWIGFGAGILFLLVSLVAHLADGSWMPTRVLLEDGSGGRIARWFAADGGVGAARLTHEQEKALAGRREADAFTRSGVADRFRLEKRSPAARVFLILGVSLIGVGIISVTGSIVQMFIRG